MSGPVMVVVPKETFLAHTIRKLEELVTNREFKALAMAGINGGMVAAGTAMMVYTNGTFNLFAPGVFRSLAGAFASGTFYGLVLYVQSPSHKWSGQERRADAQPQVPPGP